MASLFGFLDVTVSYNDFVKESVLPIVVGFLKGAVVGAVLAFITNYNTWGVIFQ